MNEVNRLRILQDVIDGRLTTSLASQRLGLMDRHCRRQLARYRESGAAGLIDVWLESLARIALMRICGTAY